MLLAIKDGDDLSLVKNVVKDSWVKKFDKKTWQLDGSFTMESVLAVEVMAHLAAENPSLNDLLNPAFNALNEQSLYKGKN